MSNLTKLNKIIQDVVNNLIKNENDYYEGNFKDFHSLDVFDELSIANVDYEQILENHVLYECQNEDDLIQYIDERFTILYYIGRCSNCIRDMRIVNAENRALLTT